jgi:hypothetical protein
VIIEQRNEEINRIKDQIDKNMTDVFKNGEKVAVYTRDLNKKVA